MIPNPLDPKSILKGNTTEDILSRMKSFAAVPTNKVETTEDILNRMESSVKASKKLTKQAEETRKMIEAQNSFISGPDDYSMFDEQQSSDNLKKQITHQFEVLGRRGYKYPHQGDIPFIKEGMVKDLSSAGIKDLRQLGYQEIDVTAQVNLIKKGDKFFRSVNSMNTGTHGGFTKKLEEVDPSDILSEIKTTTINTPAGHGTVNTKTYNNATVKVGVKRFLINKETGERVVQGKYEGSLGYGDASDDPTNGLRWGNTTRTEGMTDYMIAFDEDDQAIIFPKYSDTATNLKPLIQFGSAVLMMSGVGAGFSTSLGKAIGLTGKAATAAGNFILEGTISEISGGDFFKGGLSGAIKPLVGEYLDTSLGNSISKAVGMPPDGTFSRIAGKAISRGAMGGIDALIFGGDIEDAIIKNAIAGSVEGLTVSSFENLIDPEDISLITDNTNLSYDDVMGLTSLSVRNGIFSVTQGGDFFDTFKETLLVHGVPTVVGNSIDSKFKARFADRPESYDLFKNTVLKLSSAYTAATLRGRPLTAEELKNIIVEQPIQQIFKEKVADPIKQTVQEQAIDPLKQQAKKLFKRKKEEEEV